MRTPLLLLKLLGKGMLNVFGSGGFDLKEDFADLLPAVALDGWGWWKQSGDEAKRRAELQALAQAPAAEVRQAVNEAVEEVAATQPPEVRERLATYLTQVPALV